MGNGVCSRRQRRIFQCLLLVTVVCGMMYGGLVSYEMHKQLRRTEAMALKYQQHQESLSAQLQVVYEHRSRLEKSLQKERLEHKKAKEDYLIYKLEAEKSLNKEKQDANSRLSSLQVQHQMLKNQHDELKRQYYELDEQHQAQGEDHSRLLDEHRDRYNKLQQAKEAEISQLKEHVYNLREENKQLRKAHLEIHTQLQDAQVKHQNLKAVHDQLALTLEDHKSALAVAQVQVEEYKQLKEHLNREPNRVQPDPNAFAQQRQADTVKVVSRVHESQQAGKETHVQEEQRPQWNTESRLDHQEEKEAHAQPEVISHPAVSQPGLSERDEDGEGEAERRRELAEEEMAQAGQPQKLEEDLDQTHDEQMEEQEEEEREEEQPDENALDRQRRQPQLDNHVELHQGAQQHLKSAYEQQQEQQRLEAQRANERRQIQLRQEALQAQREKVQKEREKRLKEEQEREEQQNREADRREQLLREEHQRKRTEYENMDEDVQREEDRHTANEDERDVNMLHEEEEEKRPDHGVSPHQVGVEGEVDPEDDPNNQGEDEFEEAEDEEHRPVHRVAEEEEEDDDEGVEEEEPAAPGEHMDPHRGRGRPAVEEELVMAGNPDQQEDALEDQYQEENEAQEDVAGGEKREEEGAEEEGEDPYNEENVEQDDTRKHDGPGKEGNPPNRANEDENYEEEEEEEDAAGQDKGANQRAEM